MTQSHWLGLADTFQKNKSCLVANSRMPGSGSFLRSLKASGEKGQVRGDPGLRVTLHCQLQFHLGGAKRPLSISMECFGGMGGSGGPGPFLCHPPSATGMLQEAGRYGDRPKVWATYWRTTA